MRWCGLFAVLWLSACDTPDCTPDASLECACNDGRTGTQRCAANGLYLEKCVCLETFDAGPPSSCEPFIDASPILAPARVATGWPVVIRAQMSINEAADSGWEWWTVPSTTAVSETATFIFYAADAGTVLVNGIVTAVCADVVEPADTVQLSVESVRTVNLPFAADDVACCDEAGGAYLASALGVIARFDGEQISSSTTIVGGATKHLALSISKRTLFAAQNGRVLAFSVPGLEPVLDMPVGINANAVAGDDSNVWLFGSSSWVWQPLDGGVSFAVSRSQQISAAVPVGPGVWALKDAMTLALGRSLTDGGWLSTPTEVPTCGGMWAGPQENQILTGCNALFDVSSDGGFAYRGAFAPAGTLAVSQLAGVFGNGDLFYVADQETCGRASGATLEPLGTWRCGLSDRTRVLPYLAAFPSKDGGVWLVTSAEADDVTWLEHAP